MQIDAEKRYTINNYTFKNFVLLNKMEREMVWRWRNDERVRKWMSHSEIIPLDSHLKFVDSLLTREDLYYWVVYKEMFPVGVVDVYAIDKEKNSTEGGYYLSPATSDSGDGFEFHYYYKCFLFDCLGFDMVKGPLLIGNLNSYALVTYCGGKAGEFMEIDGKRHVMMKTLRQDFDRIKENANDVRKFIHHVRICKQDWKNICNKINE